jgi:hypothetical protein
MGFKCAAQSGQTLGFDDWLTLSGNFDVGYRKTQFFESEHNAAVGQWDSRAELWLPPFRDGFSWGPYLRIAGIAASKDPAWENGWLAVPGGGFQLYPLSSPSFRKPGSKVGKILGPLRLFGEYNRLDYWGSENDWRPHEQWRAGLEYWRALHVNEIQPFWWTEIWGGLQYLSANEFSQHYSAWLFAYSIRAGVRVPYARLWSALSPYIAVESSLTDNAQYYWENRLGVGGGIRFSPPLGWLPREKRWVSRFVVYAEYVFAAAYYRAAAPPSVPDYDVRVGASFSLGEWYR